MVEYLEITTIVFEIKSGGFNCKVALPYIIWLGRRLNSNIRNKQTQEICYRQKQFVSKYNISVIVIRNSKFIIYLSIKTFNLKKN